MAVRAQEDTPPAPAEPVLEATPEAAPEPVPPPPPPRAPARAMSASAPLEGRGDELIAYHRDNELKALTAAGLHGKKGAWLYGDYKNEVEGITTVVACAQACQADTNCYHWNFQVEKHRCDLKAENGGSNEDIADWVYGDVPRPSKKSDEI
ncbi:Dynein heavy chain 12 [Durusdinium trenchii]|uniref:Axonemal n=1 Tax=Durusdinium trenchii TaxID=1381693 RepID=A0ABP0MJ14_9DINO